MRSSLVFLAPLVEASLVLGAYVGTPAGGSFPAGGTPAPSARSPSARSPCARVGDQKGGFRARVLFASDVYFEAGVIDHAVQVAPVFDPSFNTSS